MKELVEDRRHLHGEKRSLEKDYHARLTKVCEERQTLKIELIKENKTKSKRKMYRRRRRK